MLRVSLGALLLGLAIAPTTGAEVVVFMEPGFPAIETEAPTRETLAAALSGHEVAFAGVDALAKPETLSGAELLVLPYGSAFPADAWASIRRYLEEGGNLLCVGGRPLFVPVFRREGRFEAGRPQAGYWRLLAAVDAAEVPLREATRFVWDEVWGFPVIEVRARRVFAVTTLFVADFEAPEARWRGLGFLVDPAGHRLAAPVVRLDFSIAADDPLPKGRGRLVMLTFDPEPGYWESPSGRTLLSVAADHAALGPALVWAELPRSAVHGDESADVVLHLHDRRPVPEAASRRLRVELRRDDRLLDTAIVPCPSDLVSRSMTFDAAREPGLYAVRTTFERDGAIVDVHETGFWRTSADATWVGPTLTAGATYLRRDGHPFLVMGVNHWVNDSVFAFFPENGNALEWDRDFADMASCGLTFVRTGIWFDRLRLVDSPTGTAREPVLRNIEALLLTARRHGLLVQFTLFSFEPQSLMRSIPAGPSVGRNPYTDPVAVESQRTFVRSIVSRFKDVPFLGWDLINEPSFSNPSVLFHGNQPNADPTEVAAWNAWLRERYGSDRALATAWGAVSEDLPPLGAVPLPAPADLALTRNGNPRQVRAVDYNLFAQDAFSRWVRGMVDAIRATGSRQTVAVGQDEGGVTDRLLNQFYGGAGVDMTSVHSWWKDDALLWDAVVAQRPGVPNLVGETAPQPSAAMNGAPRWDATKGLGLFERKLALSVAAGNAGGAAWIWSRSDPFHLGRQDGSATLWVDVLSRLAAFAKDASPHMSEARRPDVAIVLPQSLQLSVFGHFGLEAQQSCVRALYHHARAEAYVVGEYQIELLGRPRLILLPSPWVLDERAWSAILERVREGATLLVTGRFDADAHFWPTGRNRAIGLEYAPAILDTRDNPVSWPGGGGIATFSGDKTTYLEQAHLPGNATFARRSLGQGRVLFFSLPLELNDDLRLLGEVYRWALREAGIVPTYRTSIEDPGILICPTSLDASTLYVLTSESAVRRDVVFRDGMSGEELTVPLEPGRAALLLVGRDGRVLARYEGSPGPPRRD
jgi:hypothetical protein